MPRVRAKLRKHMNKKNPKVDVYDEWEHGDLDRDEAETAMKYRAKRWKEIELAQKQKIKLEEEAVDKAEEMKRNSRQTTPLQEAWMRCDFILFHIMETKAYEFMEYQRLNDPKCYKWLYKKFMSKAMMLNAQTYVDYFAQGNKPPFMITFGIIIQAYKKYKGIKTKFKIVHKGEDDKEL